MMLAKQYTIALPADYEMGTIRQRVAIGGPRFDTWPGLGFKAFLITEGERKRYAPFYLWRDTAGANRFLYGEGFAGLEASFGRPRVEHWIPVATALDPAKARQARAASRTDTTISEAEPLAAVADREQAWLAEASAAGALAAVSALDPDDWRLVRFALWSSTAPPGALTYTVLHVSAPAAPAAASASG